MALKKYKAEAWKITKIEVEDTITSNDLHEDTIIHHRLEQHYLHCKSTLHETFEDAKHHLVTAAEALLKVSLARLEEAEWENAYCEARLKKLKNLSEYMVCQT